MLTPDKTTPRGFRDYGHLTDSNGSVITVRQSSSAEEDAVWLFTSNPDPNYKEPHPHLTVENIDELIEILMAAKTEIQACINEF